MRLHRQTDWRRSGRDGLVGLCAACALIAPVMEGCGGTGEGTQAAPTAAATSPPVVGSPSTGHGPAVHLSSKQVRTFRLIGRRACRGMTPIEAAERFKTVARRAGAQKRFIELVTEPTPTVERSVGYPQLVAAFYATTLPESERTSAAAACAKELAAHR